MKRYMRYALVLLAVPVVAWSFREGATTFQHGLGWMLALVGCSLVLPDLLRGLLRPERRTSQPAATSDRQQPARPDK
jgi:predicted phage tail protein